MPDEEHPLEWQLVQEANPDNPAFRPDVLTPAQWRRLRAKLFRRFGWDQPATVKVRTFRGIIGKCPFKGDPAQESEWDTLDLAAAADACRLFARLYATPAANQADQTDRDAQFMAGLFDIRTKVGLLYVRTDCYQQYLEDEAARALRLVRKQRLSTARALEANLARRLQAAAALRLADAAQFEVWLRLATRKKNEPDARHPATAAASDEARRRRAAWLKTEMDRRPGITKYRIAKAGGLDDKQVTRVLDSEPVKRGTLERLVEGLNITAREARLDLPTLSLVNVPND